MENRVNDRRRALAWLAGQLRWEQTLDALRDGGTAVVPQEERQAA